MARFGEIVVEILGPNGKPVAGGVSEPVKADGVDLEVRWSDELPTAFSGREPVQLRFTLRNARLYSYWTPLNSNPRLSQTNSLRYVPHFDGEASASTMTCVANRWSGTRPPTA